MEFFAEVQTRRLDAADLKRLLTIGRLPEFCASISTVIEDHVETGVIYCVWGEFDIRRDEIKHGVRFSLPGCPNALAWTVTASEGACPLVHCTINKTEADEDLLDSIRTFLTDWASGLQKASEPDSTATLSKTNG